MSELISIVYKPDREAKPNGGYTRIPLQEALLIEGRGIDGDAKGKAGRELNILSAECVQTLTGEGFLTRPGQLGEQLIISGVDVESLPPGAQLQIGPTACIEVIKLRTGCSRFEEYQDKTKEAVAGRLGIIASVTVGGPIRIGDAVNIKAK